MSAEGSSRTTSRCFAQVTAADAMCEGLVLLVDDGLALANADDRGVARRSIGLLACA